MRKALQNSLKVSPALTYAVCLIMAIFMLCGRWGPSRLINEGLPASSSSLYGEALHRAPLELRLWVLFGLGALTLLLLQKRIRSVNRRQRLVMALVSALCVYLMATVAWSFDSGQAFGKIYELLVTLLFLWLFWTWQSRVDVRPAFFKVTLIIILTISLIAVYRVMFGGLAGYTKLTVLGGGPIVFGRIIGVMMLIALYCAIHSRTRLFWVVVIAVGFILILISGSRGALIGGLLGAVTLLLMSGKQLGRLALVLPGIALVLWIGFSTTSLGELAVKTYNRRVVKLMLRSRHYSHRDVLYSDSIKAWNQSFLFGHGIASFSTMGNAEPYPHNLILEVAVEGGLVGVILLGSALLGFVFIVIGYARSGQADALAVSLFVHAFVGSLFSGDLYDSRGVFFYLIMATFPVTGANYAAQLDIVQQLWRFLIRSAEPEGRRRGAASLPQPAPSRRLELSGR